jgi:hypothetical protein
MGMETEIILGHDHTIGYHVLEDFSFCGKGPRSRCYGRTTALRLIVQPCDEDEEKDDQFFFYFSK